MRHTKLLLASLVAALALAACGRPVAQTWPGLATDGNLVYVAQGQQVHAVSLATHEQVWAFPATASNDFGQFVSEPGLSATTIVVGSEGASSTYSGVLYGLDAQTGQQRWCLAFDQKGQAKQPTCKLASGVTGGTIFGIGPAVDNRIFGGLTLTNGVVYFGLASGAVFAVNAETGADLWRFKAERDVWGAPLVSGAIVYVPSLDHHLYALNRDSGTLVWQKDMGAAVAGAPTLDGATLYAGTFGNRIVALDAATGNELWNFPASNWVWSGPAIDQGVLYFTDVSGMVFAVDANSHRKLWSVTPGGLMRARPVLADGNLYVGDRNGNLFALDPATGATRWSRQMKGQLLVPPVVVSGAVVTAPFSGDNLLAAYSATGDLKWAFAPSK